MRKLTVKALKKYQVIITSDFNDLNTQVKKVFKGKRIAVITDTTVKKLYLDKVTSALKDFNVISYAINSGESSKNASVYLDIINFLAQNTFQRDCCVLSLGGGVVGDITGFVSATYMRGITFIQCPTTLLSCVDSSVGGKTGVNLQSGKNLLGSFYSPSLVYINTSTLNSLPEKEITNGFGEIVKYAFISKQITIRDIREKDYQNLIYKCLKIKAKVVKRHEFEGNYRRVLNLGHTVGHAVETLSTYSLSHGLCVAKGINAIIVLSTKYYGLTQGKVDKMKNLLTSYPFNLEIGYNSSEITQKIFADKKMENGVINAVLIKDIGKVKIQKLTAQQFGELI